MQNLGVTHTFWGHPCSRASHGWDHPIPMHPVSTVECPCPCAPHKAPMGIHTPHGAPWGDPRPHAPHRAPLDVCAPHTEHSAHPVPTYPNFDKDCPSITTCGSTPPPAPAPQSPAIRKPRSPPSSSQTHRRPVYRREALLPSAPGVGGGSHPITCGGDVTMGHPYGSMAPSAATVGAKTGNGNVRGDMR